MGKTLDDMAKKAKTAAEFVVTDAVSINAMVDIEEEKGLEAGTILTTIDSGENWKKATSTLPSQPYRTGVLKDNLTKNGVAGVLVVGSVKLSGVGTELKSALLKDNIFIVE